MIEIDSSVLREQGNDIKNLASDYLSYINKMFSRIDGMCTKTGEWTGNSAFKFVSIANADSLQYKNLASIMKQYGVYLVNSATKIENLCKEVKR